MHLQFSNKIRRKLESMNRPVNWDGLKYLEKDQRWLGWTAKMSQLANFIPSSPLPNTYTQFLF